jgi:hypothetical protein
VTKVIKVPESHLEVISSPRQEYQPTALSQLKYAEPTELYLRDGEVVIHRRPGSIFIALSTAGMSSLIDDTAGGVIAIIGCLVVFIGPFITVFFTKNHLTVMDMICGTHVVMK